MVENLKGSIYRYKRTDLAFLFSFVIFLVIFLIFPLYSVLYYYNLGSDDNYYGFYIFWWGILYRKIPGSSNNPYLTGENEYNSSFFLHLNNFVLGDLLFFSFLFFLFGVIVYFIFFVILIKRFGDSPLVLKRKSDRMLCGILVRIGISFLYLSLVFYLFSSFVFAHSVSKIESIAVIDFIGNPDEWKYALFQVLAVYCLFFINISLGGKKRILLGFLFIGLVIFSFSLFNPLYLIYDTEHTVNLENYRIYTGIILFSEDMGLLSFAIIALIVMISIFILQINYNKIFRSFGGIGNVI